MKEDELSLNNPKVRDMIYFMEFILKERSRKKAYHKTIRQ